jgi:hypothetical protein
MYQLTPAESRNPLSAPLYANRRNPFNSKVDIHSDAAPANASNSAFFSRQFFAVMLSTMARALLRVASGVVCGAVAAASPRMDGSAATAGQRPVRRRACSAGSWPGCCGQRWIPPRPAARCFRGRGKRTYGASCESRLPPRRVCRFPPVPGLCGLMPHASKWRCTMSVTMSVRRK